MSAADLLETAFTSADLRQAVQAARELTQRPEEVPSLLSRLASALADIHPQIARRAAQIHGVLGPLVRDNLTHLLAALDGPRWTVREAVVAALAKVAPDNDLVRSGLIQRILFDRTAAVRDLAITALREYASSALPLIVPALEHAHPRVRCRALRAFARLAAPADQVGSLLRALDDSHFRVRRDAASLLGPLGRSALPAVPRLGRCCFDGEQRVAKAAVRSLGQIALGLPADLANWLLQLTAGSDSQQALLSTLQTNELPLPLREGFISVCQRRQKWYAGQTGTALADVESSPIPQAVATIAAAGKRNEREASWLIGWLLGELVRQQLSAKE